MRQLTCIEPGKLEWHDVPEPRLGGDGEALVRPLWVARCDIDIPLASGFLGMRGPFAVGHECVGEIVALGDAVRGLHVGQRVVVSFQVSCGSCERCGIGHSAVCERMPMLSDYGMQPLSGTEYGGMLSDLIRVPHAHAMLHPISSEVDASALASVSDNVLDGYRAVSPHLRARPDSEVLVCCHGMIPSISLYAVLAARALGAGRVDFASDDRECLALAEALGARPIETDFARPTATYPIVVDAGVTAQGLKFAINSTEPEGTCQSVSVHVERDVAFPLWSMYTRGVRFFVGRTHAAALLPEVVPLIESGRLRPERVTTRRVGRDEAAAAWLEPAIKLVVDMRDASA